MLDELYVFDDFADNMDEVREKVITMPFADEKGPDDYVYKNVLVADMPVWFEELAGRVGKKIIPRMSFFRMNIERELPHSWVHSDDICAQYAAVLYMNKPAQCYGGTAMWKHLPTGLNFLPSPEQLAAVNVPVSIREDIGKDTHDIKLWEQVGMVPMRYNRLVTYPTTYFHSRYPFEGFGATQEDARLVWTCFYDIA